MPAPTSPLRALLSGLVDYAGLFPPAALPMRPAVENYARYLGGSFHWALGRFILPVARFGEFAEASEGLLPREGPPWRLSALVDVANFKVELSEALDFDERHTLGAAVDTIEVKASVPAVIDHAVAARAEGVEVFIEVPLDPDPAPLLDVVQARGLRAKGRTGGITPEAIPSSAFVARFLARCVERGLDFKCTAGLHHPIRAIHPLTYAPDAPRAPMHGFLNVFLAAAYLQFGLPTEAAIELLEETDLAAFGITADGVNWRGNRLTAEQLSRGRQAALSFGSCSFEEPIDDLKGAGLL